MSRTWIDPKTGLMWARISIGQRWESGEAVGDAQYMNWATANAAARNCEDAGFKDWRLPRLEELESIYWAGETDCSASNSILLPSTSSGSWGYYWSSSVAGGNGNFAWLISFRDGNKSYDDEWSLGLVRAVRNA